MIDPEHFFDPPTGMIWPGIALYLAGLVSGVFAGAAALYWYVFKR